MSAPSDAAARADLIARARKSYRTLDGVIVVSPKLVAALADQLEVSDLKASRIDARSALPKAATHREGIDAAIWAAFDALHTRNALQSSLLDNPISSIVETATNAVMEYLSAADLGHNSRTEVN